MSDSNSPWSQPPKDEDIATTRHLRQPRPPAGQSSQAQPTQGQSSQGQSSQGQPEPQWQPQSQATPARAPQQPGQYPSGSASRPGPQHTTNPSDPGRPESRSRMPLLVAAGVLVLALVALGIYFLTRGGDDRAEQSATPATSQPASSQPATSEPASSQPSSEQPTTTEQSTEQSSQAQSSQAQSSQAQSSQAQSSQAQSSQAQSSQAQSSQAQSSQTQSSQTQSSASTSRSGSGPADPGTWKQESAASLKPPASFSVWKKSDTSTTGLVNIYQRSDGVPGGMVVMVIPFGDGTQARSALRNPTVVNGAVCGDAAPEGSPQSTTVCVVDLGTGYVTASSSEKGASAQTVGKDLDEWMKKATA